MKFYDYFNNWPLGRQLLIIFLVSGFFIVSILVVLAIVQLDWIRNQIITETNNLLRDNIIRQMHTLGNIQGNYITNEFFNYIESAKCLKTIDSLILGFNNKTHSKVFSESRPVQDVSYTSTEIDYATGAYMTSLNQLTTEGVNLENMDTPIDKCYPIIINEDYLTMYQGYEIDHILHIYPGYLISNRDYTPAVREWYYRALESPYQVIITEPYQDLYTNYWIITASEAIHDLNNSIYGVAAVDITLQTLTEKISDIVILDTGFPLLVSVKGVILTIPLIWNNSGLTASSRIYQNSITGINQTQWATIQSISENSTYNYQDGNGTSYIMTKNNITPFLNSSDITHYLFLCAKVNESEVAFTQIINNFQETYTIIFWVTISIAIFVLIWLIISVFFVTKKIKFQLKLFEKIFEKIIKRGMFPKMTSKINFKKLDSNSTGIETLLNACKNKIQNIKVREDQYLHNNKKSFIRPQDELLYTKWHSSLYPYSYYTTKTMSWKKALSAFNKITVE